jgi:hypothetical protein
MKKKIIKTSSYTDSFPRKNYIIKVAIKTKNWNKNDSIKTTVYKDAIYDSGFVSLDGGKNYYIGGNFLFHKLKRSLL